MLITLPRSVCVCYLCYRLLLHYIRLSLAHEFLVPLPCFEFRNPLFFVCVLCCGCKLVDLYIPPFRDNTHSYLPISFSSHTSGLPLRPFSGLHTASPDRPSCHLISAPCRITTHHPPPCSITTKTHMRGSLSTLPNTDTILLRIIRTRITPTRKATTTLLLRLQSLVHTIQARTQTRLGIVTKPSPKAKPTIITASTPTHSAQAPPVATLREADLHTPAGTTDITAITKTKTIEV